MRAIVVTELGGPEVLELRDEPAPSAGPGQLLVDAAVAGVNYRDIYERTGVYPTRPPVIAGIEGAGTVSAVGEGVTDFAPGDRVAWKNAQGSYAEQVVVPVAEALLIPAGVTEELACAVLLQGMTAHYLTHSTYDVQPGDEVLVHAGAGGVGLLLTQIAKLRGARVTATTSGGEKVELAREAGADQVIGYDNVPEEAFEVVYDGVGKDTFDRSLAALRKRGMMALYGAASGGVPSVELSKVAGKSLFLTRPTLVHYTLTRDELLGRAAISSAGLPRGSWTCASAAATRSSRRAGRRRIWRRAGRPASCWSCSVAEMRRVRVAPSPTGTLHIGNALSAVANRGLGDWMLLRIDDTDAKRNVEGGEEAILEDLRWLGVEWDEGPVRQSERAERHREAAEQIGTTRFEGVTLLREDGSPTYQLATVVDDVDFGITHVVRGNDHRPNEALHRRLHEALGTEPPEYVHHGLILGDDGKKLSKRAEGATVASLREAGIPAEAVLAYLEELGIPRHDVHLDLARVRRLAVEAIERLSDEELAARAGAEVAYAPVMRGARDLNEAREFARQVAEPEPVAVDDAETLERFEELVGLPPRELVRELKAAGGDLKALRLALTGREKGPELQAILEALPREEALARVRRSRGLP